MLDVLGRIDRIGHAGNALVFAAVCAAIPWFGWLPLVPLVIGGAALQLVEDNLGRFRRPEYALGVGWVFASIANAVALALASAPPIAALPLFTLMVVGFSAVFSHRVVLVGAAVQVVLMIAAGFVVAGPELVRDPAILAFGLALLAATALIGATVGQSAFEHRSASVVDKLTGMLNRAALAARIAELEHQAGVTGQPVSLLVGDLDRFKSINDRYGHARGDDVLREVAERLNTGLRAFESVYRFGGEEFVVLLPGLEADAAALVAERLAEQVRRRPVTGIPATISFGVAAATAGEPCDFERLFGRADRALYTAKRSGRDRVGVDEPGPEAIAA
jgi:diguanylate cyclase (GGDEF)-like protein